MINAAPIFNAGSLRDDHRSALDLLLDGGALRLLARARERSPEFTRWWPITGALIGLGFLCKYTNAMQLLSILLAARVHAEIPPRIRSGPAFTRCSPRFFRLHAAADHLERPARLDHALASERTRRLAESIPRRFSGVFHLLLPALRGLFAVPFRALMAGGIWSLRQARHHLKPRFLLAFALPLWALYLWLSLRQAGEANWTAPAMISLGILATAVWHERAQSSVWIRRGAVCRRLWHPDERACTRHRPPARRRHPARLQRGPEQTPARLALLRRGDRADPRGVRRTNGTASLSHRKYLRRRCGPRVLLATTSGPKVRNIRRFISRNPRPSRINSRSGRATTNSSACRETSIPADSYYTEEQGINPFHGRTALYVTDRAEERAPSMIKSGFERVEMIACIDQTRRGFPLRQWRVFACYNYRSASL